MLFAGHVFCFLSPESHKENGDFLFFVYNPAQPCYNASRLVSTPSPSAGLPPRSFGRTGLAARRGPFSKQKMEVSQVGPLGGELHQVVAGKDHFVLLLPAVVRHVGPELLQRSHFRHEQHLGQRDGDGFPVQCADLQERHPGEQGVLDVPLGGVEGMDALIGEIQLHGRARKGSLQPHHVLQRTVRQELADQIALPGQIVDAAAVIHNDGRVAAAAEEYGLGYDLIAGNDIAAFKKISEAMIAQGL